MGLVGADIELLRKLVAQLGGPLQGDLNSVLTEMNDEVQASSTYWVAQDGDKFRTAFAAFVQNTETQLDSTLAKAAELTGQNLQAISTATGETTGQARAGQQGKLTLDLSDAAPTAFDIGDGRGSAPPTAAAPPADASAAARADASALISAERSQPPNLTVIRQVAQDVAEHQGDAGYLAAFWSAPGAATAAAGLANELNQVNGNGTTLLTKADQALLATFGKSLATAISTPNLLSPAAANALVAAFSNATGLWSAGMLIKYGPSGSAYGTGTGADLLAAMSRAALNAGGEPEPDSTTDEDLAQPDYQQALATYDPVSAILDAAASDGTAARDVLGGPGGEGYANILLSTQWTTPGGIQEAQGVLARLTGDTVIPGVDTSAAPAAFLDAATADLSSPASAQAVLNILAANTQVPSGTTLQPAITGALITIAQSRVPDLAVTAGETDNDTKPGVVTVAGSPMAIANLTELDALLARITKNPADAGNYLGSVQAKLSLAVGMQAATSDYWVKDVGALVGATQQAIGANSFQGAEKLAAEKAEIQSIASLALAPIMIFPTPAATGADFLEQIASPLLWGPILAKLSLTEGSGYFGDYVVGGGDPASALFQNDQQFVDDKTAAQLMVVQGLVRAGLVQPDSSWYQDGHIVDNAALSAWLNQPHQTIVDGEPVQWWVQQALDGMELHQ
jgi:hypothetical protein